MKFLPHSEMFCCRSPAPVPLNTSPVPSCSLWPLALPRVKNVVKPLTAAASFLYWWCQSRVAQVNPFFDSRFFCFIQGLVLFTEWEILYSTNFFSFVSTSLKNQIDLWKHLNKIIQIHIIGFLFMLRAFRWLKTPYFHHKPT